MSQTFQEPGRTHEPLLSMISRFRLFIIVAIFASATSGLASSGYLTMPIVQLAVGIVAGLVVLAVAIRTHIV